MRLRVIVYSQAEYWYTSTNKGYITTSKDYSITKDDDITAKVVIRKVKYRKRRKTGHGKPYIRKNKVYFGGRRSYLKTKSVFARVEKEIKEKTVYLEEFFRQHYF